MTKLFEDYNGLDGNNNNKILCTDFFTDGYADYVCNNTFVDIVVVFFRSIKPYFN